MKMASDNGSPLSDLSSDAFEAEEERDRIANEPEAETETLMPPAKRQKRGPSLNLEAAEKAANASSSTANANARQEPNGTVIPFDEDNWNAMSCSEDSEGDVPNSPGTVRVEDDDVHEQVRVCIWDGCESGDMGNMDNLVQHINKVHIDSKVKKFTCEWMDCSRKGTTQPSAYALKSHMRSHTKEKPNYCELPECDRAFTRSDALAKHYRTVHETESLRPSDPIPKSMQAQANRSLRIKELMKGAQTPSESATPGPTNGTTNGNGTTLSNTTAFPTELGFAAEEEELGPKALFKLLRRQIAWAEEEATKLKLQCESMEELRKQEWTEKEVLLDQAIREDIDWQERRHKVLAGKAEDDIRSVVERTWSNAGSVKAGSVLGGSVRGGSVVEAASPSPMVATGIKVQGQPEDQREAAKVLASLHQG